MIVHNLGLNIFDMHKSIFVGRKAEFQKMETILQPQSGSLGSNRKVLVLGGIGGIGKTQLAINYAKQHYNSYSCILWLKATTEATLKNSLLAVANRILPPETFSKLDDDQLLFRVSNWLSTPDNTRWLLIFDNHDEPDQYRITQYYPSTAHGSIIITTRQPDRVNGEKVKVQSMDKEEESLRILAAQSGRENVTSDPDARQLAERLDGHPLALTTAGAFLNSSSLSFSEYLQWYESKWKTIDSVKELADNPSRTLYTTWNLSFMWIQQENVQAANLLRFLAYLDHQDIWYELLQGGQGRDQPAWFIELASSEFVFEGAMQTLAQYSLVESHRETHSYSLHMLVHDWILNDLNHDIDPNQYWLAFDCVASHVSSGDWDNLSALRNRRITPHAVRLVGEQFQKVGSQQLWLQNRLSETDVIAQLLNQQVQYEAAEQMYMRVLIGKEMALGREHTSTLSTVNNLGLLYYDQGKLAEAEYMYIRVLAGYEKALGHSHPSTLNTVSQLGNLYRAQGKLNEAEEMNIRALTGIKNTLGPNHISTLDTINNLGLLYADQGKFIEAEHMYFRALAGYQKALGRDYPSTFNTINNLGLLYRHQGKLDKAEHMFLRALAGKEKGLGAKHPSTFIIVNNLVDLYRDQGRLDDANKIFEQALAKKDEALRLESLIDDDGSDDKSIFVVKQYISRNLADMTSDDKETVLELRAKGRSNAKIAETFIEKALESPVADVGKSPRPGLTKNAMAADGDFLELDANLCNEQTSTGETAPMQPTLTDPGEPAKLQLHNRPQLVTWICSCGVQLYDYYTEIVPGSLEQLQQRLQKENSPHLGVWQSFWSGFVAWTTSRPSTTHSNSGDQANARSETQRTRLAQENTEGSSTNTPENTDTTFPASTLPISVSDCTSNILQSPQADPAVSYLLLCFPEGLSGLKLHHQQIMQAVSPNCLPNQVKNDTAFPSFAEEVRLGKKIFHLKILA